MAGLLGFALPLIGQGISYLIDKIRGAKHGASKLSKDELVLLHKNEAVIPADVRKMLMKKSKLFKNEMKKLPKNPQKQKAKPKPKKAKKTKK